MTLQQIYYVMQAAAEGSLNKTAEKLCISQPTLTTAIRELESELGIVIFHRGTKGVSLTPEGKDFLDEARQVYQSYELLKDRYRDERLIRQRFSVSTQHYSFAVKAFVDTIRRFDTRNYEFAIHETRTIDVIQNVSLGRSEIGILFESSFNQKMIERLLREHNVEFTPLGECTAYVYLHKSHPLAGRREIGFEELTDYPCLSFEQGDSASAYLAEEILMDREYDRIIKASDRATMLNLMIGVHGYTLCSGVVCEELNGSDYLVIPFRSDENYPNDRMTIGYLTKRGSRTSRIGEIYIRELKRYL